MDQEKQRSIQDGEASNPEEAGVARRIADRTEVEDVIRKFTLSIDMGDWEGMRSCFAEEFRVQLDPRVGESPDKPVRAEDWAERAKKDFEAYEATHHFVSVYSVELNDNEAKATSYFQASHYMPGIDGSPSFTHKGYYEYRLTRTEGTWKISEWVQHILWGEGNRAVLDRALAGG